MIKAHPTENLMPTQVTPSRRSRQATRAAGGSTLSGVANTSTRVSSSASNTANRSLETTALVTQLLVGLAAGHHLDHQGVGEWVHAVALSVRPEHRQHDHPRARFHDPGPLRGGSSGPALGLSSISSHRTLNPSAGRALPVATASSRTIACSTLGKISNRVRPWVVTRSSGRARRPTVTSTRPPARTLTPEGSASAAGGRSASIWIENTRPTARSFTGISSMTRVAPALANY
jgi:hypothetical protein